MLGELIGSVEGTKTLAIVNFRPEYTPPWAGPPSYREISLEPLGPADTRELLRDLAGEDPSLDGLAELIHERTAGNPFFIEEIVRELAEAGNLEGERGAYRLAGRSRTPACRPPCRRSSPRASTGSTPDAKQLLQVASVVGKEIGERALRLDRRPRAPRRSSRLLCELTDAGFLYEAELYPERVFAFRHPLTREVAYGTQLAEQRAATHAAAARATDRARTRSATTSWRRWSPTTWRRAARRSRRRAGRPAPPTGRATAAPATRCGSGGG